MKNSYKFDKNGKLTHIKSMGKWNNKAKTVTYNDTIYYRDDKVGGWVSKDGKVLTKKLMNELDMKETKIRQIIREEISKLTETEYVPFNWKTPEAKGAKSTFRGEVWIDIKSKNPHFIAITGKNKGDLYKFTYGIDAIDKPFVEKVKSGIKIDIPSDKDSGTFSFKGITFGVLGEVSLYKLKDGRIVWEY